MSMPIIWLIISFVLLWVGSGTAVKSVTKLAARFKTSSFLISFLLLGVLTSLTEIFVGSSALATGKPEIFVGNLIGSSMLLFLFIIPIFALIGNGIALNHTFSFRDLCLAVVAVAIPAIFTLDNGISTLEASIFIFSYIALLLLIRRESTNHAQTTTTPTVTGKTRWEIVKILISVAVIVLAGQILIKYTVLLGEQLGIPTFVIGLLVVSFGTNIPEFSIGIRSLLARRKGVAFGNYLGSASFNTFLMGILGYINGKRIPAEGSNFAIVIFLIGLLLFLKFARSRNTLSRREGAILFVLYVIIISLELWTGPGWKLL
ncbi:sodium:calcium antiporter [bacterium]|nr:sodium:calcium antiporter [bacterium]